ncbi:hypothetical protein KOW79_008100 [Hemibagrus wyckioides]|uniref:Uncharacterized protein n=1 Tax=Hemibagrus wyckioides TaxID=337641 RepID=A0A9D3NT90_9TELE|nr:hypothetical protein KOW79_008100 [Hemibagrus wyckioides]
MGISGSRKKKVTPASVAEGDTRAQTLKCQTSRVRVSRGNTQRNRISNKKVAEFSADHSSLAEEVDRILETCENTRNTEKRSFQKSPLYLCEKYTFCYNHRDQRDTIHTSDIIVPSDLLKPGRLEDKKDQLNKTQKQTVVTAPRADPLCTKTPHVPGICEDISLALPVSYDASEEDLMTAIEREFG